MFGPNSILNTFIATNLRQGNQLGLPAETHNYSALLDGASDEIQGAKVSTSFLKVFEANEPFTIHISVKIVGHGTIFTAGTISNYIWLRTITGTGGIQLVVSVGSTVVFSTLWDAALSLDTWHDIVITANTESTRAFECHVDKVKITSTSGSTTNMSASQDLSAIVGLVRVGSFFGAINTHMYVDRICSWDDVLLPAEIIEIYDNTPDLIEDSGDYTSSANLVGYFKIEEGSGTTISDSSGNTGPGSVADMTAINPTANFWSGDTRK